MGWDSVCWCFWWGSPPHRLCFWRVFLLSSLAKNVGVGECQATKLFHFHFQTWNRVCWQESLGAFCSGQLQFTICSFTSQIRTSPSFLERAGRHFAAGLSAASWFPHPGTSTALLAELSHQCIFNKEPGHRTLLMVGLNGKYKSGFLGDSAFTHTVWRIVTKCNYFPQNNT